MADRSRMNGLNLSTSQKAAKSPVTFAKTNLGALGAKVTPLKASNSPGAMTAPSAQGPVRPGTK